jgi:CARDB protein
MGKGNPKNPIAAFWPHVQAPAGSVAGANPTQAPAKSAPAPKDKDAKDKDAAGKAAAPTDPKGLRVSGPAGVADAAGNDEAHPTTGVKYDFYAVIVNEGKKSSGRFFVTFKLTEDQEWEDDYVNDDGLKPGESVKAVVHFGKFAKGNYRLDACVYSDDEPDKAIHCAGEFGFPITR